MPRRPAVIPSSRLELQLPQELFGRLTLELWSEVEGRVPYGKYSEFFSSLLRERFASSRLDLSEILPGLQPGVHWILGDRNALDLLRDDHRRRTTPYKDFQDANP